MRMKEHFWPAEQTRRPSPVKQAIKAAVREFKREMTRQKQLRKVRDQPDVF